MDGSIHMKTKTRKPFKLKYSQDQLMDFCTRYPIRKLAFFGSVLRDDFDAQSDVDVLVEFIPGQSVGLIRLAQMELELSTILGRKADLRTAADLSRYFRDEVLKTAEMQYVVA